MLLLDAVCNVHNTARSVQSVAHLFERKTKPTYIPTFYYTNFHWTSLIYANSEGSHQSYWIEDFINQLF